MAKRFEELRVWQEARELNRSVLRISGQLIERRRFGLENQLTRASLSIMNNIAEGFDRGGNREFRHFLIQSKGSNGEMKSMMYVLLDEGVIEAMEFDALYERYDQLGGALHRLIRHVSCSDFDGYSRRNPDQIRDSWDDYDESFDPAELNTLFPRPTQETENLEPENPRTEN